MAKRMLKPKKAAACQRELNALLTAMERKENGEANVNIRMLQTALEHCLHQAEQEKKMAGPPLGLGVLARATKKKR
ncbi:hypothetical protein NSK_000078 [Nannochloropsis salina CCMP1776]|uniref:Uncharacterized protein n=1 Tax=Nannochloropsis salina CCMP1776 TaxID=1027361 RepID=A0A4D9DBW3_9STRA|nr:hypothetical protein NSK_000078 [Nannochloropsis salina CCMP1776]|eukprot:TFJ88504.1 hypothetical protein NSK_000078 [Nannochloropsis salina CCMP1776]